MYRAATLLVAALFTGGIIFSGTECLIAATEGEASEEVLQEEYLNTEEMEKIPEVEDEYQVADEEQIVMDDENPGYPDEVYQGDKE